MKGVPTLLRLKRTTLDSQRLLLAKYDAERAEVQLELDLLDAQVSAEKELVGEDFHYGCTWREYLQVIQRKREVYSIKLEQLERAVDIEREHVAQTYKDIKSLEILYSRHQEKKLKAQECSEQKSTEDMILSRYKRS